MYIWFWINIYKLTFDFNNSLLHVARDSIGILGGSTSTRVSNGRHCSRVDS